MEYSSTQWRGWSRLPAPLKLYLPERNERTIQQGLLMRGNRLVIPITMWLDVLDRIHDAHQGIVKCRGRERQRQREREQNLSMVARSEETTEGSGKRCSTCIKKHVNTAEPVIPSEFIDWLWQKVAADQSTLHTCNWLLLSLCWGSQAVPHYFTWHRSAPQVHVCTTWHPRPAVPANTFSQFQEEFGFTQITSSPNFPQVNGEVESAVQTVKILLRKVQTHTKP